MKFGMTRKYQIYKVRIGLKNLWKAVEENQKDINYKYEIISFDENICVINRQMTRTMTKTNEKQKIDGIFQISLNNKGKCILFKQWRYVKFI